MTGLVRSVTVALVLALPVPASAFGWLFCPRVCCYRMPVYRAPMPVCVMPVYTAAPTYQPAPPRTYAKPAPAGPSGAPTTPVTPRGSEPPRVSESPKVGESPRVSETHSYFDAYPVAPRAGEKPNATHCAVGFWNLTDHDVRLTVAGQSYPLGRGQNMKLDLDRQFVWRVDQREPQNEQIPASESALEIVIRR